MDYYRGSGYIDDTHCAKTPSQQLGPKESPLEDAEPAIRNHVSAAGNFLLFSLYILKPKCPKEMFDEN